MKRNLFSRIFKIFAVSIIMEASLVLGGCERDTEEEKEEIEESIEIDAYIINETDFDFLFFYNKSVDSDNYITSLKNDTVTFKKKLTGLKNGCFTKNTRDIENQSFITDLDKNILAEINLTKCNRIVITTEEKSKSYIRCTLEKELTYNNEKFFVFGYTHPVDIWWQSEISTRDWE